MSTLDRYWNNIYEMHTLGLSKEKVSQRDLEKVDSLIYDSDHESIATGLVLINTLAPEYLCRYLQWNGCSLKFANSRNMNNLRSIHQALLNVERGNEFA